MAREIYLQKGNIIKKSVVGFSWTTLFFGAFVPLFRGDWLWFLIMLAIQLLTADVTEGASLGLAQFIFAFVYNKIYTRNLIEKEGFSPADEYSRQVLIDAGILKY